MPKQTKITCDACNADITSSFNHPTFRLVLHAESLPITSNWVHASLVHPPIEHDLYFCNLACLKAWITENV